MAELSDYVWQLVIGLAFLVAYLVLLFGARRVYIARANADWTAAQRAAFRASLIRSSKDGDDPLARLEEALGSLSDRKRPSGPSDHIAEWVLLHEAKRQAALFLLPDEQLLPRFERALGQLDELPVHRRIEWHRHFSDLTCNRTPSPVELRSSLVELLAELYNARDAKYAQLASLYSKAFWLIGAAFLPLAVLVVLGYGVILLAGAVGGLISRLQRLVYAEGLPTAYGSSWVPLFCAPLLGALAAWGGLHLLTVLQSLGVIDLKSLLPSATDIASLRPAAPVVGVAVLLGLSERLLNRFGQEADKVLAPDGHVQRAGTEGNGRGEPIPRTPPVEPRVGTVIHGNSTNGHGDGRGTVPLTTSAS